MSSWYTTVPEEKILGQGTNAEKKQIIRTWVDQITLTPETLEVEIHYKVPESMVVSMGAAEEPIANYPPLRIGDIQVKKPKHRRSADAY